VFAGFAQAQSISPGVRPGMAFDYTLASYWSSSDSTYNAIPQELLVINYTTHVEVRISSVNNTHVATANPWYYKDETSNLERGATNLFTGEGYGFVGIIAANLKVGDKIHPNGNDDLKVLDTTTRNYGGSVNRATNHVRVENKDEVIGITGIRDLYFDKETGILVEQIDTTETIKAPFVTSKITWKLTFVSGVDDWTISDALPTIYVLLMAVVMVVAVIVAIIVVYKKKISKHKTTN
jgi:hypothetical protein